MHFLSCAIPDAPCNGVASRILPGSRPGEAASVQTLVACGRELRPLEGANGISGLELGPPLQLYSAAWVSRRTGRRYTPADNFTRPAWDPYSSAVYMRQGRVIVRLGSDNTVTVVAGDVEEEGNADGPGSAARFNLARFLTSDGTGSLYVTDGNRIRKLQLPGRGPGTVAGQRGGHLRAETGGGLAAALTAAAGGAVGGGPGGQVAAAAEGEVQVSTLAIRAPSAMYGLAFEGGSSAGSGPGSGAGSLLLGTRCALYRLPLGDPTAAPSLLAGAEGECGTADGRGGEARFECIQGVVLDGQGSVYAADWDGARTSLRRVAADGTVTTPIAGLEDKLAVSAILPNRCLALSGSVFFNLQVLGLGLALPRCHAAGAPLPPAAPAGAPPRTLCADLGALLGRQPDGTADVAIVVGGRTFHAHRLILSARSDYFAQRLGGGFADGGAQQLSLPDADPDAFEVTLRFVYTDAADIPAAQAQAVAELADRLLLPELRDKAAAVVEASVSAATVPGLLLWAEARGPAFAGLLSRLKGWFLENRKAVMREAGEEVRLLAASHPDLYFGLMCKLQSERPPRTQ
ncbi:ARM REPEAT PROTEIN INTERACTING WITH ABF2 [Tetrabaena socialis]|uniref:ARM REPEAT PROTEIN INTERACTING WITH ABF2 n=1 Tax=Tetrabaena socialis TaxID=47790 RepID=A0A2J7ZQB4_9CHLO|nr:ARM REPEAT PROTEIN INTERACTING WITH ABF2 [Tetrabaena socialis]|eukprot:PNH02446.1 ARM REPEAT PROTEIN INTERACTING WITH ABF2 [Tetrabaena socialis]